MARLLHGGRPDGFYQAAILAAQFAGVDPAAAAEPDVALELVSSVFYGCLNSDRYDLASAIAWSEELFTLKPKFCQMVWRNFETSNSIMLMGSSSTTKSYSMGVRLLLEWVRDPEWTSISLVGPSEDHLRDNLFSHLVTLHQQSVIPLPGITGDLFIGMDPKRRHGSIRGVVIPLGKRPAGRLQGRKRRPRKTAHPKFGKMSRMFVFLDELEKIPSGVWKDIDNIFSQTTTDIGNFKIIGAFNPEDPFGNVATRCEPVKGWENFQPDDDEEWTSKRGWRVVRLDAAKCENVIAREVIYPGLQTYEGFQKTIENSGGLDSPGYWTMCRACFPRTGAVFNVIPSGLLSKMRGEFIFLEPPTPCGAVDIALEGGDVAEFTAGRYGKTVGYKRNTAEGPADFYFEDERNQRMVREGVQQDQMFALVKGDTVSMANQIKQQAQALGIEPGWLIVDRTGNGAGVHDYLKATWSGEVRGLNYSEGATDRKILQEDTKTAKEEHERAVSEVWFALKKYAEFDLFKSSVSETVREELDKELGGRRYAAGKLRKVESKEEYKSRGNPSPNKADATTLLVHIVRLASGNILSGLTSAGRAGSSTAGSKPVCRVDITNRFADLDTEYG